MKPIRKRLERMEILPDLFLEKCKVRNIDFGGP
ncbi:unnamed protein product, partial [marine sediment metagenome]